MMRYDKGWSLKSFIISWYLPWHSDTGGRINLLENHRLNHFSWESFHLCALWMHDLSIFSSLTSHSTQSKKTFPSVRTLTLFFFLLVSRFTSIYPSRRRIEEKHQRKKILRIFHSLVSHYVLYDMKKFVWYKGIVKSTFAIKTSTLIQKC